MKGKIMKVSNSSPLLTPAITPSFGALKSLKFSGELRGTLAAKERILDVFEKSEPIKNFCKNFNVRFFFSSEELDKGVDCYMDVVYSKQKKTKSKLYNFIADIFQQKRSIEKQSKTFFANDSDAVNELCSYIIDFEKSYPERTS